MDTKAILKTALFTPGLNGWGLPLLFEGPPGVGKSGIMEGVGVEHGLEVKTIIASIREPSDFGGLPIPKKVGERQFVEYAPAMWAADMAESGRGLVFVDELSTVPPAVQKALLRLVLNRALGDFEFPKGVRFVAAQNAVADAAGGWDLTPPLANRFGHLRWEMPTAEEWNEWLIGANGVGHAGASGFDPKAEEERVLAAWPKAFAMAKGAISGFINVRSELLYSMPAKGDAQRSKAWPSHRTWEMATRAMAGSQVHGLGAIDADDLIAAFVGTPAYAEFKIYESKLDLPDPEKLLDGEVSFKHDARRLDRTIAVLQSCAAFVTTGKLKQKKSRIPRLWTLLTEIAEIKGDGRKGADGPVDITVPCVKAMVRARGQGFLNFKEARPILNALQPILAAAGITAGS